MRNLKKILALALALVMTLSLMTVANAFTDSEKVDADYAEAVAVLAGMGVFEGYEDGSFKPQGDITRAEVAAIVYRLATGDVTDKNVGIHKDHAQFTDVPATHWAAGYIGYCANAQLIKGYGDGTFGPGDEVTGYQALAMILRAVGYDVNGEFTGEGWEVEVAEVATDLGLLYNVTKGTLGDPATRELVAEILFQAAAKAYIVKWTNAFGYQPVALPGSTTQVGLPSISGVPGSAYIMNTLGYKNFKLTYVEDITDKWGRPSYGWTYTTGDEGTYFDIAPLATYAVATTECDIASVLGLKTNKEVDYKTYVNGAEAANITTTWINAVDTTTKVGAQGRLLEVYKDRLVMIDTFLANVDAVAPATFDAAGHLKTEATLYLTVYDRAGGIKVMLTNGATNYAYTAGQKLLVNAQAYTHAVDTVDLKVAANAAGYAVPELVEIVGVANSTVGAQTVLWYNTAKHTVAGTTYDDAVQYHKDDAANIPNTQFTWFFDQYGNLIGSDKISTTFTYATIANIQWFNPASAYGYAQATLVYIDGTTETVVVKAIDQDGDWVIDGKDKSDKYDVLTYSLFNGTYATGSVSANYGYNADFVGKHLFAVAKDDKGVVTLSQIQKVVTKVNVVKGNPTIQAPCYVDDATQFLVRSGKESYTWTPVTGYNQITSLNNATVYYVNLDGDAAAEIVYMYGEGVTTPTANLVYIANASYKHPAGTTDLITLLGAQINGAAAEVTVNSEWLNGTGTELSIGDLYYMVDTNGDGDVDTSGDSTDKDIMKNVCLEGKVDLGKGTYAEYMAAGSYKVLANAIQTNTVPSVDYNTLNAVVYGGTVSGLENIVVVYNGVNVSAIYVVA